MLVGPRAAGRCLLARRGRLAQGGEDGDGEVLEVSGEGRGGGRVEEGGAAEGVGQADDVGGAQRHGAGRVCRAPVAAQEDVDRHQRGVDGGQGPVVKEEREREVVQNVHVAGPELHCIFIDVHRLCVQALAHDVVRHGEEIHCRWLDGECLSSGNLGKLVRAS